MASFVFGAQAGLFAGGSTIYPFFHEVNILTGQMPAFELTRRVFPLPFAEAMQQDGEPGGQLLMRMQETQTQCFQAGQLA